VRPVSAAFLAAVQASHTFVTKVDILRAGQPVPGGTGINVVDGSVTLERTAEVRGRCSLTIQDPALVPMRPTDPVSVYGNEIRVWRGVRLPAGDELVSLGVFGIQSYTATDPGRQVRIDGLDRSQLVRDATLTDVYTVAAGSDYVTAILALISDGVPGLATRVDPVTVYQTPLLVFDSLDQGGRWAAAQQMATDIGCELFFDGDGVLVLRSQPSTAGTAGFTVSDGDGGALIAAEVSGSRSNIYNAVIATSSNSTAAPGIRGFAADDDPNSPTWYGTGSIEGSFGRKPRRYSSPFIANQAQADSAAWAILQQSKGLSQGIRFTMAPNPALEPGDIVTVNRAALGVNDDCIIDTVEIGLTADAAMTATVRSIRHSAAPGGAS
jgi:hypothetical protein